MGLAATVLALPVTARHAPASSVLVVAFVGGVLPDLDLVTNHRRTLHFPVLLPVGAVACLCAYGVLGGQSLFLLAVGLAAAGLHSASDVLGGGLGYEPWRNDSTKAVYNHVLDRWHAPRRFVRYSGAPEDFLLGASFAVPASTPRRDAGCRQSGGRSARDSRRPSSTGSPRSGSKTADSDRASEPAPRRRVTHPGGVNKDLKGHDHVRTRVCNT
jgi:hypothetical protein